MSAFDLVKKVRNPDRPTSISYVAAIFSDFMELHGDRHFGDDKAIITGLARLNGQPVTIIAQERGRNTKTRIFRNFGAPRPEGYRKALRQMKLAEKFKRPIICFIDTSGAACDMDSELRGQGSAIAQCIYEMSDLKVPIISLVVGEGGSGGALALGFCDELWMLSNSFYSVISPEGCASILWKDISKVEEVSESLKFTAKDLKEQKICARVFTETTFKKLTQSIQGALTQKIEELKGLSPEELTQRRYENIRRIGVFSEEGTTT